MRAAPGGDTTQQSDTIIYDYAVGYSPDSGDGDQPCFKINLSGLPDDQVDRILEAAGISGIITPGRDRVLAVYQGKCGKTFLPPEVVDACRGLPHEARSTIDHLSGTLAVIARVNDTRNQLTYALGKEGAGIVTFRQDPTCGTFPLDVVRSLGITYSALEENSVVRPTVSEDGEWVTIEVLSGRVKATSANGRWQFDALPAGTKITVRPEDLSQAGEVLGVEEIADVNATDTDLSDVEGSAPSESAFVEVLDAANADPDALSSSEYRTSLGVPGGCGTAPLSARPIDASGVAIQFGFALLAAAFATRASQMLASRPRPTGSLPDIPPAPPRQPLITRRRLLVDPRILNAIANIGVDKGKKGKGGETSESEGNRRRRFEQAQRKRAIRMRVRRKRTR